MVGNVEVGSYEAADGDIYFGAVSHNVSSIPLYGDFSISHEEKVEEDGKYCVERYRTDCLLLAGPYVSSDSFKLLRSTNFP